MSEELEIGWIGPGQMARLREIVALFAEAFEDRLSYPEPFTDVGAAERLLSSPNFLVVGAYWSDLIVGGIAAYILPRFHPALSEIYIYDLAVDARFRRRGIATAMIAHLQRYAYQQGISSIYVQADVEDEAAVALYSKLGIRKNVFHFDFAPQRDGQGPIT